MNIGKLQQVDITTEMQKSYLDYAMSVIVSRALPDVRDGLKPVHRRVLYAMHQMGLHHTGKHVKSAKVVGEVLGKYHPHGDTAVYDTMVRLAQKFSLRYPLIHGQGNFGSVDGDPAAAMRYTEVKLSSITEEMLYDIEKETCNENPNFDNTLNEPSFLPAKLPNLLLMGSDGIAVGMATKIPTHNLSEVVDALIALISKTKIPQLEKENELKQNGDKIQFESTITIEELLEHIKGPDFPTAGIIYDWNEIVNAYTTGKGKIIIRAKAEIEEMKNGRFAVIVTELPYQVNKSQLMIRIADLVKDKKIEGISDLRDESDRRGIRVVVELKRDAKPKAVLNNLFKHTNLQTSFPVNMVALVDGTPLTLTLKEILSEYLKHRYQIVIRRSLFELKAANNRAHILEGLKIALDHLEAVIKTIRQSKDAEIAKENLITRFKLSELQAIAILDMQLRRLAALERQKIEDEYLMIQETIAYLKDLLAHPEKILSVIKNELLKLKEKYGDVRRTKVIKGKIGEFSEEDLVPYEGTIVTITKTGYIKRLPPASFKAQNRGGRGVTGMTTKEQDEISMLLSATTHDDIFFFTNKGRVFNKKVFDIPETSRQAKGQALINLINMEQNEIVSSVLTLEKNRRSKYLFMVTKKGIVKKTEITSYSKIRANGLIAIKLEKGDELIWVRQTSGSENILLVTHNGKSIRFDEKDVRPTGRDTMGVRGIKLANDDYCIGMEVFTKEGISVNTLITFTPVAEKNKIPAKNFSHILVVMENGIGKRTDISQFPIQNRGGQGVKVAEVTSRTGKVTSCRLIDHNIEQVILTSKHAIVIKLPVKNIPLLSRPTQGVILMRLNKSGDKVAAVTCV